MELTREHFDEALAKAVAPLATKQDVREAVEELARLVSVESTRVQERLDDLDVSAKLRTFERKFQKLEEALHITL